MKQQPMPIASTRKLNQGIYQTVLRGDTSPITAPGQFINLKIPDHYLRRPISIADWDECSVTIIYKVVGSGTSALSQLSAGTSLDVLTGLGNGFDVDKACAAGTPTLLGGGIGTPPIYGLAKTLVRQGVTPTVITGFATAEDVILQEEFRALGIDPVLMTDDGSAGEKGFVTDALAGTEASYVCVCGPEPMLRAVWNACSHGQFSFEARMACGFGACMGCSCRTKYGNKRICKDGPVLEGGEILW